ncbi:MULTISPECIES: dihydrolipoamide acetyltransferase family protein [Protofrankia]|uniref:Dihydrolipoamide acetyltransferase component of pyruvate dehydrogenase complex n=2 Tax=Candidatus Protofrankia datiscae TaxID=2716812 RepID=F8B024_9ACTN|nr:MULTISPECIES: dihydrolipoamide acetyltransferase family protein [Protofrankia]AEH11721.1 Dihydrolipoyllysine-residue acetyltransferase [Candidatus Protofrankia datiscae]
MSRAQFRLPDLGEGLPDAEIVRWLVEVGEHVAVNQPIAEVETAKALVEVPSPFTGVLAVRHAEPGDTVEVGQPLVTIDTGAGGETGGGTKTVDAATDSAESSANSIHRAAGADATAGGASPVTAGPGAAKGRRRGQAPAASGPDPAAGHPPGPAASGSDERGDERMPVLVGYGPRGASGVSRRASRRSARQDPADRRQDPAGRTDGAASTAVAGWPATRGSAQPAGRPGSPRPVDSSAGPRRSAQAVAVLAKPPVRKLARDLGVDLGTVVGTGPHGTISRADVEAARTFANGHDTDQDRVRRIPVTGVRRATAQAMVSSVANAPQATEFVSVDVTETMAARDRLAALPEFADVRVTPLLFVAKALLTAVGRQPMINSRWEDAVGDEPARIAVHGYVNLGIAVASPRGLVVPNIADADRMSLVELAHALHELTVTARGGKSTPEALRGGTITITNVGVFGVDIGTPILNPPEAAILALGAIRPMPWVHEGELAVRTVAQLALTFDHRIVDGELGSRVLADVARMLTDPTVALAWN